MQPVFQLRWVENPSEMSILKDLNIHRCFYPITIPRVLQLQELLEIKT
jgi:hypothetical protein